MPLNFVTYQQLIEGNSCGGILTYYQNGLDEQREWIMAPLSEPMVPGQTYYCSFRANAAFGGNAEYPQIWLANDLIGMLFTTYDSPFNWNDPNPVWPNFAHVLYEEVLTDTIGWTLVSGSFVADSAYQFVMIGQFFANAVTDTLHFADPNSVFPWYPRGYTLIDEVCVSANPLGCDLGQSIANASAESVLLFPNPTQDELSISGAMGYSASFVDAQGRMVWEGQITSDPWALGVRAWQRGMYVLRFAHGEETSVIKFVLTEE